MFLHFFILTAVARRTAVAVDPCEPCDLATCDIVDRCLAGVVTDRCDCCQVCGRTEGELCDPSKYGEVGMCGDNLECRFFKETDESICMCTEEKMVCGSDGVSYGTPCQLNQESVRRSADPQLPILKMEYWGPCKESPVIISPPSDTYGPKGANLTLNCEAKGFPAPIITWQYDSIEGRTISLPSDDQMISVQMRGGPEPMMATGWAQIISLDPSYSGVYHCIASNSEGKVHASATVGVYREEM
ncbi:insulin-like growth factor-binding protein-related protein 1 isoform X2 [Eurytemora carolleeae]|uniref:insulin-like growth factor-binding protein-related protein 1 isoform X2 n=1 Tax=Eurytemora carolleeae TaxID=1294199 RepID=UPI000C7701D7|nr:insulin-like growth factor-binding protein-related protein 1 isoform X2 [Eurytemora carolleeae]|eukprot:XP_023336082.1 insulin-like growth factor-binding protein-related protein 1 isoform X2 [Eurytemora affinis]